MSTNANDCTALLAALEAVAAEVTYGVTPYSTYSYLPEHIKQQVFQAIAQAKAQERPNAEPDQL